LNNNNSKKKIKRTTNTEAEIRKQIVELRRKAQIEAGVGTNTIWRSWFTARNGATALVAALSLEHKRGNPALAALYEQEAVDLERWLFRLQNNIPQPVEEKIVIPLFRPQYQIPVSA
jgi:hypothetical protein